MERLPRGDELSLCHADVSMMSEWCQSPAINPAGASPLANYPIKYLGVPT